MSGVKGRSGRYKPYQTSDVNKITSLSIKALIKALKDPDISNIEKARISAPLVMKRLMPDQLLAKIEVNKQLSDEDVTLMLKRIKVNSKAIEASNIVIEGESSTDNDDQTLKQEHCAQEITKTVKQDNSLRVSDSTLEEGKRLIEKAQLIKQKRTNS